MADQEHIPEETTTNHTEENNTHADEHENDGEEIDDNAPVTVFVNPNASDLIKHPLEHGWTLWFDSVNKKQNAENWGENLKQVYTFRFVEDFWGVYNSIIKPSQLQLGSNFHMFKEGVRPAWEDPANTNGGKWLLQLPMVKKEDLDAAWQNVVLGMIGEAWSDLDPNEICGAVCSPRRTNNRIALWTRTGSDKAMQEAIGRRMKQLLNLTPQQTITYQQHNETRGTYGQEWRV
eukprot:comp12230_c0_seq1/m.7013 comp12230_c0_seq1/g.7013  ORF comp12230_c0_seq1/g.7013 comp12230_c0_seq1/m.7013 type:complete len:233 (-) comp12230_c0_seq1:188-886(-)